MLESTLEPGFARQDYILRDYLAADRTLLANERTFLASIRTALTSFVVAGTFIKFFTHPLMNLFGWIFMPLGMIAVAHGFIRYRKMKKLIFSEEHAQQILESHRRGSGELVEMPFTSEKKPVPVRPS